MYSIGHGLKVLNDFKLIPNEAAWPPQSFKVNLECIQSLIGFDFYDQVTNMADSGGQYTCPLGAMENIWNYKNSA